MKLLTITLKDLKRGFRSALLLGIMFLVPLGTTALIYLAFSGLATGGDGAALGIVLAVANADVAVEGISAGELLIDILQGEELASLLQVQHAADRAAARALVDDGAAPVALLIGPTFSASLGGEPPADALPDGPPLTLYHDPASTIAPGIVQAVVGEVLDAFAAGGIAARAVVDEAAARDLTLAPERVQALLARYQQELPGLLGGEGVAGGSQILARPQPEETDGAAPGELVAMLGAIMAGQMLFAAFFAAAISAESVLREQEEHTLARLFTTPTARSTILAGKLLTGSLLVVVQTVVLMVGTHYALGIVWGEWMALALLELGLAIAAPGFGVFLISWARTTRQAGALVGAGLTATSMAAGLFTPYAPGLPDALLQAQRLLPQGWAMRGWMAALAGGGPADVAIPVLIMVLYGGALFIVGALRFRRRFA